MFYHSFFLRNGKRKAFKQIDEVTKYAFKKCLFKNIGQFQTVRGLMSENLDILKKFTKNFIFQTTFYKKAACTVVYIHGQVDMS